jgi:hypothetical protein
MDKQTYTQILSKIDSMEKSIENILQILNTKKDEK